MTRGRLEAFSDGVIAIIITIMVLELHAPATGDVAALRPLLPKFASYLMSFIMLAIYWNNHHHLMHTVKHVDGRVLWGNIHLLFWLSLMPFVTAWSGATHFASLPVAAWGMVQFMCGIAYFLLVRALIALHGRESVLAAAIGRDFKGYASLALYAIAILIAWASPMAAIGIYAFVGVMWLIPDPRIERRIER